MSVVKKDIRALSKDDLMAFFTQNSAKAFRGKQVYEWLWKKGVHRFEDMTNISKQNRQLLEASFTINHIEVDTMQRSSDGTVKNAVRLHDGLIVESVLIPTAKRTTACVSSQVGCSLDCKFCATSRLKRMRNLNPDEIYDQVVAIDKITSDEGLGMSPKRIVVSTSGIPKMIKKMAEDAVKFNLAVSLHSAIDEVRTQIMPFNKSFPLKELREALEFWYAKTKRRITYEYVVWEGVNDKTKDILALIDFCKFAPSKVNLIEYNPIDDGIFQQAKPSVIDQYVSMLEAKNITVTVRRSRGKDIDAACGQLANKA